MDYNAKPSKGRKNKHRFEYAGRCPRIFIKDNYREAIILKRSCILHKELNTNSFFCSNHYCHG